MSESKSGAAKHALLLDDNLMSSMRVSAQLERMGYTVQVRRTVEAAGALPELVIINLGSRGLNGVELITTARGAFAGARVIGFCGHLEAEIRRAAKTAGIDRILTNDQAYTGLQEAL